jgi:hypothetical protein
MYWIDVNDCRNNKQGSNLRLIFTVSSSVRNDILFRNEMLETKLDVSIIMRLVLCMISERSIRYGS